MLPRPLKLQPNVNPPNLGSQTLRLQKGAAPFTMYFEWLLHARIEEKRQRQTNSYSPVLFIFGLEGFLVKLQELYFPAPRVGFTHCLTTAALPTPQKFLSIWKLFKLKMLDFSGRTRASNSILTPATYMPPG